MNVIANGMHFEVMVLNLDNGGTYEIITPIHLPLRQLVPTLVAAISP